MPSKYLIREFEENTVYHVFSRGVEKRKIFLDEQDYRIFLYYVYIYLSPPERIKSKYPKAPINLQTNNLSQEVDLLCYCLMPNHFHFLLKLKSKKGISKLMKQLINAYTKFFNDKYRRESSLFGGRYKAAKIPSDELLLHVSRYIHLNPVVANLSAQPQNYKWSSYSKYLNDTNGIINPSPILAFFKQKSDYEKFVLDQTDYAKSLNQIKHLTSDI